MISSFGLLETRFVENDKTEVVISSANAANSSKSNGDLGIFDSILAINTGLVISTSGLIPIVEYLTANLNRGPRNKRRKRMRSAVILIEVLN